MSVKIKPPRRKLKRRGNRLIEIDGDRRAAYAPHGEDWRVVEVWKPGKHINVAYSPSGRYSMIRSEAEGEEPDRYVVHGDYPGDRIVAIWFESRWMFFNTDVRDFFVTADDTGILNSALVASAIASELDSELADFVGVTTTILCRAGDIHEILSNPRYARLRAFRFDVDAPPGNLGTGRRAENIVRHQHTNYDAMLADAGGLLYPEEYQRVRQGVDRIVANVMRKPLVGAAQG